MSPESEKSPVNICFSDASKSPPRPSLLDEVLLETLRSDSDSALDALREVAGRHGRSSPRVDAVAHELILSLVRCKTSSDLGEKLSENQLIEMAWVIASTLIDTPDIRDRLQSLWERLCGGRQ
jgi:hypothetical protein